MKIDKKLCNFCKNILRTGLSGFMEWGLQREWGQEAGQPDEKRGMQWSKQGAFAMAALLMSRRLFEWLDLHTNGLNLECLRLAELRNLGYKF